MFKIVRKEFQFGRETVVLETGAWPVRPLRCRDHGWRVGAGGRGCQEVRQARSGFLPADRQLPGKVPMLPAVSRVATASVKAVRPKRKP
jgi:hypothetical protein